MKISAEFKEHKKMNIKKIIAREGLIFVGFLVLGFLITLSFFNDVKRPLLGWRRATFFFYGIYLTTRFIIWAIRTLKEK